MKTVMVAGPRKLGAEIFAVSLMIDSWFANLPEKLRIIHGAAEGVDSICAEAAERHGHGHEVVPYEVNELDRLMAKRRGNWNKAPLFRTIRMLDNDRPDQLIAWWDGRSSGTGFTITQAKRRGIPVIVFAIKD